MKNVTHITKLVKSLDSFNLSETKALEAFDPKGLFSTHLYIVRYMNLFPRVRDQSEESHSAPTKNQVAKRY